MAKEHAKQQTQAELQKAHKRIAELEQSVITAQQQPPSTDSTDAPSHKEEIEAQTAITEKAKRGLRKIKSVEIQAQHWPSWLKKPRTESVGTDRLGRVPSRLGEPMTRRKIFRKEYILEFV